MLQNKNNVKFKNQKETALELIKLMPNNIKWSDITSIFYERERLEKMLIDACNKGILTKEEAEKRSNLLDKKLIIDWLNGKHDFI